MRKITDKISFSCFSKFRFLILATLMICTCMSLSLGNLVYGEDDARSTIVNLVDLKDENGVLIDEYFFKDEIPSNEVLREEFKRFDKNCILKLKFTPILRFKREISIEFFATEDSVTVPNAYSQINTQQDIIDDENQFMMMSAEAFCTKGSSFGYYDKHENTIFGEATYNFQNSFKFNDQDFLLVSLSNDNKFPLEIISRSKARIVLRKLQAFYIGLAREDSRTSNVELHYKLVYPGSNDDFLPPINTEKKSYVYSCSVEIEDDDGDMKHFTQERFVEEPLDFSDSEKCSYRGRRYEFTFEYNFQEFSRKVEEAVKVEECPDNICPPPREATFTSST